jgi:hypothetical protein
MKEQEIMLFGQIYLLIGDIENGGAIASKECYENFECPYAHLYPNGRIMRFGEQIATRDDIIVREKVECIPHWSELKVFEALFEPSRWANEVLRKN